TEAFLGRIHSMARSYDLVSREQWGEVSLQDTLASVLGPHAEKENSRIKIGGPEIAFAPPQALALGTIFHELVTNAMKYGALAKPKGRVSVTWGVEKGRLVIAWLERDGPKVTKPGRRGFGTELIERELKSTLGARVTFDYAPEGIEVQISIPYEPKYVSGVGRAAK